MRAAKIKEHPGFALMKQTDIQKLYYMQMPRWLFSDPRYSEMSLDAKVTYTFLLNRFQLSRKNGWINEYSEVFVIFPRKALAKELRVCEQRVTAAFKKLIELELIWEKRCGRGDANQIYLASVQPVEDPEYECAPFLSPEDGDCGSRTAEIEVLAKAGEEVDVQEPQNPQVLNRENGESRAAEVESPEPQDLPPNKKERSYSHFSKTKVSQSVKKSGDGQADDEEELLDILDGCELSFFDPELAKVFENAIERLFYSDSFRIGNATLPQCRVRSKLHLLDGMILRSAEAKLTANLDRAVKNSTAFTMSVMFNSIAENESDLLVDPYLNSLRMPAGRG